MKPSALRIERLLAKVEAEHNARIRLCRYVVYEDEYDEAIAKGLPLPSCFALMPRDLSREEWIEKYRTTLNRRPPRRRLFRMLLLAAAPPEGLISCEHSHASRVDRY